MRKNPTKASRRLRIVMAASEGVPFSKTGGLADVVGSLPAAIARLGHDVSVFLPYYAATRQSGVKVKETGVTVTVPMRGVPVEATVLEHHIQGRGHARVYFIRNDDYYDREGLYQDADGDYTDNAERFMFYSRAVLAAIEALKLQPDIIHCHDWQTALIPALARGSSNGSPIVQAATVFTIHNLAFQGVFWHLDMEMTGLPWSTFTPAGIEYYGKINMLKAGIVYADVINTVSRRYSKEIQTEEFGCGLDGVLRARKSDVFGILNGVDYDHWDPATDPFIAAPYGPGTMAGKKRCRQDLLAQYGLKVPDKVPVLGMVGRLTEQKGLDILAEALSDIINLETCFVLLGGTGAPEYHEKIEKLARRHPGRVGVRFGFDNALAHKIEAGSDLFLMPSRFEPCGLNQMYSLRYGTVPIVRATGGLDDTITEFDPLSGAGNGFKFTTYSAKALLACVRKAVRIFGDKRAWTRLVANGMQCDFSWAASARKYVELYNSALKRHAGRLPAR
ncbi:MAG: glycogen synthase GlgA [Verrucomicrobia bacterium]|nr:glycogen synthase GlgA [Verrucomicrobiota bacterium]